MFSARQAKCRKPHRLGWGFHLENLDIVLKRIIHSWVLNILLQDDNSASNGQAQLHDGLVQKFPQEISGPI